MMQTIKYKHSDTAKQRLESRYSPDPNTGCWLWIGTVLKSGKLEYGVLVYKGKKVPAHRLSYETFVDKIPDGKMVLHKCDTPACINPDHLSIGNHKDNMLDAMSKGRKYKLKTHCVNGHELIESNVRTVKYKNTFNRKCRECELIRDRIRQPQRTARRRAKKLETLNE